jgi:hypothetical protein
MTAKRLHPHRSETQDWESSAARNPPSRGRARAIARQAEIRSGGGSEKDAAAETPVAFPGRSEPCSP